MRSDINRWERKYQKSNAVPTLIMDPLLVEYANLLRGSGLGLDLAAGACHTSVQLTKLGYQVIALDCSLTALQIGQRVAAHQAVQLQSLVVDLSNWPIPTSAFEVITCFRYLNREIFPKIQKALKPGGLLIYKTFNQHHLLEFPTFNPNYLLRSGELAQCFSNLEFLACHDGTNVSDPYSFVIAQRPETSSVK